MREDPQVHVLIALGRTGRYWGNRRRLLSERAILAERALERTHRHFDRYDAVILTGGPERRSNQSQASLLHDRLQGVLERRYEGRVTLREQRERNRVALLNVVDDCRIQWQQDTIRFDVVAPHFAIPRYRSYLEEHADRLEALHGDSPSPRMLYWHFLDPRNHGMPVTPAPFLTRIRERVKARVDAVAPYPVPLVKVH